MAERRCRRILYRSPIDYNRRKRCDYMTCCDVCGKRKKTYLVPGAFGAYSFSGCAECIEEAYEPYEWLTYAGGFAKVALSKYPKDLPAGEVQRIRHILDFYGKTDSDFMEDCKNAVKEREEQ